MVFYPHSFLLYFSIWILQEPKLFESTIRANIALGAPGATDEQIEAAARMANCDAFIKSFPVREEVTGTSSDESTKLTFYACFLMPLSCLPQKGYDTEVGYVMAFLRCFSFHLFR